MAAKVGQVVNNKYRLLRHLGDGGMGSVYEARHETLGTTVALKFLHLEFSRREGLVQRFVQEARASAQIQSPYVVRVSDVDQTADGDVFIVMEYLEGRTLQTLYEELYRAGRRLSYIESLSFATQMLEGAGAAHRAGIVHRDLKPDNVMITTDPKGAPLLKLLDFGIAKLKVIGGPAEDGGSGVKALPGLTRPGAMMGTPEYMAPEQAYSADAVDARADLFSLGVMIFEMLAGRRPVGGDDPHELAESYRSGRIAKLTDLVPTIAPELAAAVHRAMAPRPEERFATAAAMLDAIEPFAAAVRQPSPSRLRAGGTIGVSPAEAAVALASGAYHDGGRPPMPPGPAGHDSSHPPANGPKTHAPVLPDPHKPAGVAKTWPPDDLAPMGAPPAQPMFAGSGTVIDAPAHRGDRTEGMPHPYVPGSAPTAVGAYAHASPPVAPIPPGPAGYDGGRPPIPPGPAGYDGGRPPIPPGPAGYDGGRPPIPPGPAGARRRRRSGVSVSSILLVGGCVAGLAIGVTYLASRPASSSRDRDDAPEPPPAAVPVATAAPQPPAPHEPAASPEPPPYVPPPQAKAPPMVPRPGPSGPRPKPPLPAPSSSPGQPPPSQPPVLVIPSAFPFPNPFQP